jgi:hypothetical protein
VFAVLDDQKHCRLSTNKPITRDILDQESENKLKNTYLDTKQSLKSSYRTGFKLFPLLSKEFYVS